MHSLSEIGGVIRSIVYEGIEVERNPHFVTVLFGEHLHSRSTKFGPDGKDADMTF